MKYFSRDLSWLSFNERVLLEAADNSVPLYERVKFMAIYSSNLDEFFRVRVAFIKRLTLLDKGKVSKHAEVKDPKRTLGLINKSLNKQLKTYGSILKDSILPDLLKNKIHLYYNEAFHADHLAAVEEIFYSSILSFIQPMIIRRDDPSALFLENRQLYIISELTKNDVEYIGLINIPVDQVSRFHCLPKLEGCFHYAFVDDVIKHYSKVIFSGFDVKTNLSVKLNRDAELFLEDDYSEDVANKIRKSLVKRKLGMPARFLFDPEMSRSTVGILKKKVGLFEKDCLEGGSYHNMSDFFSLPNPIGARLEDRPFPPLTHSDFVNQISIFDTIDKKDIILSFPYQKYDYILRLFNEAAIDPEVVSIKATLYRVAKDSHITNALISAAKNKKKVSVLIEAKARFDEENNLKWAEQMKDAGVQISFSDEAIKVHAKVALITRKKEGSIIKYAFLGTGNFNERTAGLYTDYALLTRDVRLTEELDQVLRFMFRKKKTVSLAHLLVAQINMPQEFTRLLDEEIENAKAGQVGAIKLKLNNLQDTAMIKKLYQAADAGVKIQLIIRGISCLIPRKNIQMIRIVDRFLEHGRIYVFHNKGLEKIFLGSADWMERNLRRRIEVVFPIYDDDIKKTITYAINLQLADNTKAVLVNDQLENVPIQADGKKVRAQYDYYKYLKRKS